MLLNKTDIRYTLRLLAKKPGFTLLSILVLAGGLGISIFTATISYTLMFKELPITNGDRIYHVCYAESGLGCRDFRAFEFAQLREDINALDNVGVYQEAFINLEIGDELVAIPAVHTEWNMFGLSETRALLGRTLQPGDHAPGAEPVALIGHAIWQQLYDGGSDVIGTLVDIRGVSTRIVGVMPEGYRFPSHAQLWLPASADLLDPVTNDDRRVMTFALLRNGVDRESASAEIAGLMYRVRQLYPPDADRTYTHPFFRQLDRADTGHIKDFTMAALGGIETVVIIGFINFIAFCIFLLSAINVGTLMLARTNERIKDVSIRHALGAPRKRLLVQTMAESCLIVLSGGILALLLAGAAIELLDLFVAALNESVSGILLAFWHTFEINRSTLLSVLLFLGLTLFFTSAVPCLRIINGDFNAVMRDGTRGALGLRAGRFSKSLVLAAITMITLLIYISAIAYSQVAHFRNMINDFNGDNRITTNMSLPVERYDAAARETFFRDITSTLSQLPSISGVQIEQVWGGQAVIEKVASAGATRDTATFSPVMAIADSRHLDGTTLLEGRPITLQDVSGGERTALISQHLASQLWLDGSPVDETIRVLDPRAGGEATTLRVVGVISDTINVLNPLSSNTAMVYIPITQSDTQRVHIEIITTGAMTEAGRPVIDEAALALSRFLRDEDSTQVYTVEIFGEVKQIILTMMNRAIALGVGCSLFALLVALAGIYGLTQNAVQLMTQEIGTRRALGATDRQVRNLILRRGSRQVLFGFLLALVITSPLTYIIYFLMRNEILAPVIFPVLLAMLALYGVVYLAMYSPIRKALQMEPGDALRYE